MMMMMMMMMNTATTTVLHLRFDLQKRHPQKKTQRESITKAAASSFPNSPQIHNSLPPLQLPTKDFSHRNLRKKKKKKKSIDQ
jgi:hypothetical protein